MHEFNKEEENNVGSARVPILRFSYAFNISQTSLYKSETTNTGIISAEELISRMQNLPTLKHNYRRCAYSLSEDYISLPKINDFDSQQEFYSAYFHELIHATGHSSRLNRISAHDDREQYSEEELTAEIGSAYLCAMCGISNSVLDNQAAYLKGWMSKLKHDPAILIRASILAKNAVNYLIPEENINGMNKSNEFSRESAFVL